MAEIKQCQLRWPMAGILLVCVALAGCSTAPKAVRTPIPGPGVAETQQDPALHLGKSVRWGGTIIELDNQAAYTDIQIVSRDLDRGGRPRDLGRSKGRFVARVNRFLDPADFEAGRQITVTGRLAAPLAGKIGEHPYTFPVVEVSALHLWEPETVYPAGPYYWPYADPWWHHHHPRYPFDPFYWHRPGYRHPFRHY